MNAGEEKERTLQYQPENEGTEWKTRANAGWNGSGDITGGSVPCVSDGKSAL